VTHRPAFVQLQYVFAELLDAPCKSLSVHGTHCSARFQDEEVQRPAATFIENLGE